MAVQFHVSWEHWLSHATIMLHVKALIVALFPVLLPLPLLLCVARWRSPAA